MTADESCTDEGLTDDLWIEIQRQYVQEPSGSVNPYMQAMAARFLRILDKRPQASSQDLEREIMALIRTGSSSYFNKLMGLVRRYGEAKAREAKNG